MVFWGIAQEWNWIQSYSLFWYGYMQNWNPKLLQKDEFWQAKPELKY